MSLKAEIEALLFASEMPLTLARLQEVLPETSRADLQAALETLERDYDTDDRAIRLQRVAGGYQLCTRPELAEVVRRLFVGKRRVRLTRPALEVLAIIAYKQPTTRPEIDAIRGVGSGGVVETLLERSLVRIAGRADSVGRPLLYATTPEFLQYLGLDSLHDLPSLEELEAMLAAREEETRRLEEEEAQELAVAPDTGPANEEGRFAAAKVEDKLRQQNLPTLEDLDAELQARGEAIETLTAQVGLERREHRSAPPAPAATEGDGEEPPATEPEAG